MTAEVVLGEQKIPRSGVTCSDNTTVEDGPLSQDSMVLRRKRETRDQILTFIEGQRELEIQGSERPTEET